MASQSDYYLLAEVLAIARIHPFYVSEIRYPPGPETIRVALDQASAVSAETDLKGQPLLRKSKL